MRHREQDRLVAELARGGRVADHLTSRATVAACDQARSIADNIARMVEQPQPLRFRQRVVLPRRASRDDPLDSAGQVVLDRTPATLEIELAGLVERRHQRAVNAIQIHRQPPRRLGFHDHRLGPAPPRTGA